MADSQQKTPPATLTRATTTTVGIAVAVAGALVVGLLSIGAALWRFDSRLQARALAQEKARREGDQELRELFRGELGAMREEFRQGLVGLEKQLVQAQTVSRIQSERIERARKEAVARTKGRLPRQTMELWVERFGRANPSLKTPPIPPRGD